MIKHRIHEIAKDMDLPSKDIMDLLKDRGVDLSKKHMTVLDDDQLNYVFEKLTAQNQAPNLDSYLEKRPQPPKNPKKIAKAKKQKPAEKLQTVTLPVKEDPKAAKQAEEIAKEAKKTAPRRDPHRRCEPRQIQPALRADRPLHPQDQKPHRRQAEIWPAPGPRRPL